MATTFDQDTFDTICERIAQGESLRAICRESDMPAPFTVQRWMDENPTRRAQYVCAREMQAETFAEEIVELADKTHVTIEQDDGEVRYLPVDPQRSRLQVDTRKWVASKLKPGTYGDKLAVEHSGSITLVNAPTDELLAELHQLMATGHVPKAEVELVDDNEEAEPPGSWLV